MLDQTRAKALESEGVSAQKFYDTMLEGYKKSNSAVSDTVEEMIDGLQQVEQEQTSVDMVDDDVVNAQDEVIKVGTELD